ncbi:transposase family protein, partial [Streptomyces erythrochromogenes]|uniref:transposase family protein n=1 Tax=Streptomyces erythrochromogenes TaxID=285574 RepID=UPI0036A7EA9D
MHRSSDGQGDLPVARSPELRCVVSLAPSVCSSRPRATFVGFPVPRARLACLPDPRARRGRLHGLVAVLLTAACAVLAGARSYAAIGQWARHAPQETLARLGSHPRGPLGVRRAASPSTVRRVLVGVCPGGLAGLLGHSPSGTEPVAVDGRSARGPRTDPAPAAHLLPAVTAAGPT